MKVSVIIPVYNVEKYLRECLDSVVNQTLREIEIICVDDGSTDGSSAILAEYAAKDPRVKVITRPHTNAGAARNAGMAVATGEYLGFVDSDDWCELTLFEKAYAKAKADVADVVFFTYRPYNDVSHAIGAARDLPAAMRELNFPLSPSALRLQTFLTFNLAPWNRIVRRSFAFSRSIVFQEQERSNDVGFGCLSVALADRLTYVDDPLYFYRVGLKDNLQSGNEQTPDTLIRAWEYVADELTRRNMLQTFAAALATTAVGALFYMLHTWQNGTVYDVFYHELKVLFTRHPFFGQLDERSVQNTQSLQYYLMLKESVDARDFLMRQERFNAVRLSRWLTENVELKRKLAAFGCASTLPIEAQGAVGVVIIGGDDVARDRTQDSIASQSLQPKEIVRVADISADVISEAVAAAEVDYICLVYAGFSFPSPYSLERAVRGIGLDGPSYRLSPMAEVMGTVFLKSDVSSAVCAFAAWPQSLPEGKLTERQRTSLALLAQSLVALDVRNLSGRFYELIAKTAGVCADEEDRRFLCRLLHESDYEHYREFMSDYAWKAYRDRLDLLYNLAYETVPYTRMNWASLKVTGPSVAPRITYVVPAMNVELYLPRCIESLRRQTVADLAIICVDDGSWDGTGKIMDAYAQIDSRITVIHQENHGLGASRNIAMDHVRSEYVAFVDGDDWLAPNAAEVALERADRCGLDFCSYDMRGFNYLTRESVPFFWNVSRQIASIPVEKPISLNDFKRLRLSISACLSIYRMSFLRENGLRFSTIGYGEDMIFSFEVWAKAKRFMVLNRPFYNYRRGQPTSMVTRLSAGNNTGDALAVQKEKYVALLDLYKSVYKREGCGHSQKLFRENVIIDILYYTERSDTLRRLFASGMWEEFDMPLIAEGDVDSALYARKVSMEERLSAIKDEPPPPPPTPVFNAPPLPAKVSRGLSDIVAKRRSVRPDLYVVTGQLNSTSNEPIDSWTFFRWLQDNDVPSRYVIWKRHAYYAELERNGLTKDVIALDGDGVADYEFFERTKDILPRVKAVVQENSALNYGIRKWMLEETDIAHVFLQHGVFFTTFSAAVARVLGQFSYVNVSSERERQFMLERTPPGSTLTADKLIIGGLPRWDLLKDEPDGEKTVLVMLTWRASFNEGMDRLMKSAYYNRLRELLSPGNVARLAAKGLKIVLAPHHHLSNLIADLDFHVPVKMIPPGEVSKWIRKARMLVTDFSSVSVDFLFQNKPVVYWTLDSDDFTLDRTLHDDGGKVYSADHELKTLFNVTRSSCEVMEMICKYADSGFRLEPPNRQIAESFFANKTGISRRVYEALENAMSQGRGRTC